MIKVLFLAKKGELGIMLTELLIAAAIGSVIAFAASAIIFQLFTVNGRNVNHMDAVGQLENVLQWVSRDSQMAQTVVTTGSSGFPCTLTWVDWDNNSYAVTYYVVNGEIRRSRSVNGGVATEIVLARSVDSSASGTNCQFTGGVLSLKISVTVGAGGLTTSETRLLNIAPRPVS